MSETWGAARKRPAAVPFARPEVHINRIGFGDLREALARGWEDFLACPTQLVFLCMLYPLLGLVFARAAATGHLLQMIYPMVAGFALVGPVAALGLYEISRRRERGEPVSWTNTFDVLKEPGLLSIAVLAVALVLLFLAWLSVALRIYEATMGVASPASVGAFISNLFGTWAGWRLIILGNAVGFLFAMVALVGTVIAFPLILDRQAGPVSAVEASVRATLANPVPMAAWGLIVAVVLALGMLPVFVGLAVALPVLGHATWHLYRRLVD
ncbi:MAG TPA: DUF2189 domain-containing protein [Crenalkalicoccus sp.]|jgi:uncharacterized membrane protein|nr:DUF2189 domain-containing protein [Crenalkalicoccus sp.]